MRNLPYIFLHMLNQLNFFVRTRFPLQHDRIFFVYFLPPSTLSHVEKGALSCCKKKLVPVIFHPELQVEQCGL